ncbi:MAG: imidazolonepropionase [Flavobacteriales bacterium]|nr:imidazolonepropionase [Flavobacteriales bacterium]
MSRLLIKNAKALVGTHTPGTTRVAGAAMAQLPMIEHGWLLARDGRIEALGTMADWPGISEWKDLKVIDASGRYVLPGWCDPHTHTVFAAPRDGEFVDRIKGMSYQDIAAKGGGILNSALRLREMSEEDLFVQAKARLDEMMRQGTVAVEIKSGYGLSLESELKMLRVVRRLREALPLRIKATLLAAHALPPEFAQDRAGYVRMITDELIPQAAAEGLADFVDVFCETNYFTVEEMTRVLEAGAKYDLRGKVHVNQFTSLGAIPAAVKAGALSVDHLEVMENSDIAALALAPATIPTLLPSCSFFLRIPYAPARALIDAGTAVALASDHNPGSTPSGNMNLVLSLACIQLRILPEEALNAATLNASAAMDLGHELGSLTVGKRASFILTKEVPSLSYLPYAFGSDHIDTVIIDGEPVRAGAALA